MNKYTVIGGIILIIFLVLCIKLLDRVQYYQKTITSTTTQQRNSAQTVTDSINNEVDDNGNSTQTYKKFIDITVAYFRNTTSSYDLIFETADRFPMQLAPNEQVNIEFNLRDAKNPKNEIEVFGNSNPDGSYLFTANAGNSMYSASAKAERFLPGKYIVKNNIVGISIPKSFLESIGLVLSPDTIQWQLQTQYTLLSSTSQDVQESVNNFLPNNKDNWISY